MTCLMISGNTFLFVRNYLALLLRSDPHLDESFLKIFIINKAAVIPGSTNGSFIQQVLKICTGKARRGLSQLL